MYVNCIILIQIATYLNFWDDKTPEIWTSFWIHDDRLMLGATVYLKFNLSYAGQAAQLAREDQKASMWYY